MEKFTALIRLLAENNNRTQVDREFSAWNGLRTENNNRTQVLSLLLLIPAGNIVKPHF